MIHVGGYHGYRGGVQYPGGSQITKDFPPQDNPHGTEQPHDAHGTVNPHGTQDVASHAS